MYEAVITGLGVVAPNGVGKDMFWDAVTAGKSGIRRLKNLQDSDCPCQIAGVVPPEWISEQAGKLPEWIPDSKNSIYSVLAAILAFEDSGLSTKDFSNWNSAVYMGVSIPDMDIYQAEYKCFLENGFVNPDSIIYAGPHTPATLISHLFRTFTNVVTVSTACTSGAVSINVAADNIMRGESDIVIAGGVEAPLSPFMLHFFSSAGLAPIGYNETPDKASRPFDNERESGLLSEGAGVIILEEKSKALRRKARIYASFSSAGSSMAMNPSWMKTSFLKAMEMALNEARLKPEDIDYISACAPGHPVIDQIEIEAIKEIFGERAYSVPISSLKSMIGNPGAASGPLQIIATVLSIFHNYIPPTVNLENPGESLDLDFVPIKGRTARLNRVLVNLRGIGGDVSSLIFSRPDF